MGKIRNKSKDAGKYLVNRKKTKDELQKDEKTKNEDKLYWSKVITAIVAAFVGRVFLGLVGWWMLLWMVIFWFAWPFVLSFLILRFPYEKEKGWKERVKSDLKTGVGAYFICFMLVGTICHTLMIAGNYPF
jgi:hypothetical protein